MSRNSTKISGHTLSLGHLRWPKLKIDKGSKKIYPAPLSESLDQTYGVPVIKGAGTGQFLKIGYDSIWEC